jgi:ribosome biogenesis GTPase
VVVLTKADLAVEPAARAAEVLPWLRAAAGEAVVVLDGRTDAAREALRPWLRPGITLALLGASGAGKSTLANTLLGQAVQLTGAVREGDDRGRHHTTARSLHATPSGACLIDSPGLRALRLDVDEVSLENAFDDIAALAPQCRFRDCRHEAEPGCAVAAGVSPQRLAAFLKLRRSVERDAAAGQRLARLREARGRGRSGEPARTGRAD